MQITTIRLAKSDTGADVYPPENMLVLCQTLVRSFVNLLSVRAGFGFLGERIKLSDEQFTEIVAGSARIVRWENQWAIKHSEAMGVFKGVLRHSFAIKLTCTLTLTFTYEGKQFNCDGAVRFAFGGLGLAGHPTTGVIVSLLRAPATHGECNFKVELGAPPAAEPQLTEWRRTATDMLLFHFAQCLTKSHPLWLSLLSFAFDFSWSMVESKVQEKFSVYVRELIVDAMRETQTSSTARLPHTSIAIRGQPPAGLPEHFTLCVGVVSQFSFFVSHEPPVAKEVLLHAVVSVEAITLHHSGDVAVALRGGYVRGFLRNDNTKLLDVDLRRERWLLTGKIAGSFGVGINTTNFVAQAILYSLKQCITRQTVVELIERAKEADV